MKTTFDAYLTFEEWLWKHYKKKPEELTDDEDMELYESYWSTVNEWVGFSEID